MFLYTVLLILHIIISICLLVVVLLQSGKGGGLSGAFGGAGATQTMFGGRGAGDMLTRTTQILGASFMVTSLVLVLLGGSSSGRSGISAESQRIIEEIQERAIQAVPATPPPGATSPFGELGDIEGLGDAPGDAPAPGAAPAGGAAETPDAATETPSDP